MTTSNFKSRDRRLELSGRRRPGENRNFLRMERSYGPFRRTFELAAPVEEAGITAAFDCGILRIVIPKRATTARRSPSRRRRS